MGFIPLFFHEESKALTDFNLPDEAVAVYETSVSEVSLEQCSQCFYGFVPPNARVRGV